ASASENGVLLFQSPGEAKYPVSWWGRDAHSGGPTPISAQANDLRLSPDQTRAAMVDFGGGATGTLSIYDLKTGSRTRLTFQESVWFVAWSPDGQRIVYSAEKAAESATALYAKRVDGTGERELLLSSGNMDHPTDWSRDGRYIVFNRGLQGTQQVWVLPLFGDRKPFPLFADAKYDHEDARISPNGKWISYVSAEAGPREIYVTSFPKSTGKWQVGSGYVQS